MLVIGKHPIGTGNDITEPKFVKVKPGILRCDLIWLNQSEFLYGQFHVPGWGLMCNGVKALSKYRQVSMS